MHQASKDGIQLIVEASHLCDLNFEKKLPMKRYGNHQELANLAAYMMSDYSGYMNGEVVTLDGGEWIYNAGEFNKLEKVPKSAWSIIERAVRGKKKK